MPSDDRERWNHRYRDQPEGWLDSDPFLEQTFSEFIQARFPRRGSALDLAGGAGRHSIWLAKQDWKVTLIDISETGIELARQKAGPVASHISFVVDDLTQFRAAQTQFDLVMVFYYLERRIFPEVLNAIAPGGILLYKTYTTAQVEREGGPKDPHYLLQSGELLRLAGSLEVLHYREAVAEKATAEIVARKRL